MNQEQEGIENRQSVPQVTQTQTQSQPVHKVKECIICGEEIKDTAKKCTHCNSFQNWQRYFEMSSVVLSLLVALLSVTSTAVPTIIKAFTPQNSHLAFTYLSSQKNSISIIAFNSGIRPGVVTEAKIIIEGQAYPVEISSAPIVIEPEKSQQIQIGTVEISKNFYVALETLSSAPGSLSKSSSCEIDIQAIEFNGSQKTTSFVKPCIEVLYRVDE
jgi:hypothetical protein